MLKLLVLFVLGSQNIGISHATHCYECTDIPHLTDCSIVRRCNSHEECYVEQVVTTSGNVVFNSGCRDRQSCVVLNGRSVRAAYNDDQGNVSSYSHTSKRRATDVSVCVHCCDIDYCNNQGCFDVATPVNKRGPYCFSCQRQGQLESCRHVTQCNQDQTCFIEKMLQTGVPVYNSHCIEKSQCDAIKNTYLRNNRRQSGPGDQQVEDESFKNTFLRNTGSQSGPGNQQVEAESSRRRGVLFQPGKRDSTLAALCILCCDTDFCNNKCIESV